MTEAIAADLLPPNRTDLDLAIANVTAPRLSPEVLRTTYNPSTIPTALLPWLAWSEDVPLWPENEAEQRHIIAVSHQLHGMVGTAAGLEAAARLTGAKLTGLISPPSKTYLSSWSEPDRRGWLDRQPQLRMYPHRVRAVAQSVQLGHAHFSDHPALSDALYRSTTRTTLWRPDGTEQELVTREWSTGTRTGNATIELARNGISVGLHIGEPLHRSTTDRAAHQRLWRLDQRQYRYGVSTLTIRTAKPSLSPLSSDVDIVSERAARPGALAFGVPVAGNHLCRLDSANRFYRRVYLHDPSVTGSTTASPAHLGATRLGMPPFHIEARTKMPPRRSRTLHAGSYIGASQPGDRQARQHMRPTLDAMEWMRAEADKVLVNTRQSAVLRARQTIIAGSVNAGQILEN